MGRIRSQSASPQDLRAAERIFNPLAKQIGEGSAEKLISNHVRRSSWQPWGTG